MRINIKKKRSILHYMFKKLLLRFISTTLCIISVVPVAASEQLVFSAVSESPLLLPISEILRRAYRSIGIDMKVIPYPGLRSLRYSESGVNDGELFADKEIEKDDSQLIRVDIPLREAHIYLFSKKQDVFYVDGWKSIPKDYTVGYIRGVKFVENAIAEYDLRGDPSDSTDQLFLKLDRGRNKVVVSGKKRGSQYTSGDLSMGIVVLEPSIHTSRIFHYLHKKHHNLHPLITQALQEMDQNGQIKEIFKQVRNDSKKTK